MFENFVTIHKEKNFSLFEMKKRKMITKLTNNCSYLQVNYFAKKDKQTNCFKSGLLTDEMLLTINL